MLTTYNVRLHYFVVYAFVSPKLPVFAVCMAVVMVVMVMFVVIVPVVMLMT